MREYTHEYASHWFYTPTPFEKITGIWPMRSGRNLSKPHYKIGPRFITYYSIHFVLEGKGNFSQDGFKTPIKKGDIFCLHPKKTHQYSTDPNDCLQMFWFAFDGRQAKELVHRIGLNEQSPHISGIISEELKNIIDQLEEKFSNIKDIEELDRISLIYKLFSYLSKAAYERNLVKEITSRNWLKRGIEYMNTHYAEGISVSDVANYVGLHRSYFTSSFTDEKGIDPLHYLLSLKMEKALQMLKTSDFTITEIALSIGYSDLYSFSRAFKSYFGESPKHFKGNKTTREK